MKYVLFGRLLVACVFSFGLFLGNSFFVLAKEGNTLPQRCHAYGIDAFINFQFEGTGFTREETLAETSAYTRYRIGYLSNSVYVSGILNLPSGEGSFPLIILNHGYIDPSVYTNGRGLKREQDYLARQGFAVLHTDYRNHAFGDSDPELAANPQHRNFFYGADAINAILAVQNSGSKRIDVSRVGMLGHSMGGGVTMAAVVARPDLIDAGVLYAPVHSQDFYNFQRRSKNRLSEEQLSQFAAEIGPLDEANSFLSLSPQYRFDRLDKPFLIFHGTQDESVPIQWGYDIQEAFQQAGVESELVIYEGEAHEFITQRSSFMESVATFFKENT